VKISSGIPSIGSAPDSGRSRPVDSAARRPTTPPGAEVQLSPLSSRLQELEASVSSPPAVDSKRIAEIKQAIAEGRFKVNPERIADGLLNSVREMLKDR